MKIHSPKDLLLLLGSLALVFAVGCGEDEGPPSADTNSNSETENPTETPEPTKEPDSGQLATPTPEPTPEPDRLVSVSVSPTAIAIDVGATFVYRAEGGMAYGSLVEVVVDEWQIDDPAVVSISEDGILTGLAEGVVHIQAVVGEVFSESVTVEVVTPGTLEVQVIDANTRLPLEGATVYRGLDGTEYAISDQDGNVTFTGDFSGAQTVTAAHEDYHYATLQDAVSKHLVIPVRSSESTQEGEITGSTDWSGMGSLEDREIRIGIATRSFEGSPLSLDTSTIIGRNRTLIICGLEVDVPSNIVGQTPCDDQASESEQEAMGTFSIPATNGLYDTYMLSGDLPYSTVVKWIDDAETLFTNLGVLLKSISNMNEFAYDHQSSLEVVDSGKVLLEGVAPDGYTSSGLRIRVPDRPEGIEEAYLPMIFAIADMGDAGSLPVGIAGADYGETGTVWYSSDEFGDRPLIGLILAGDQGVGALGAYVSVMGVLDPENPEVITPEFMEVLQLDSENSNLDERTFAYHPISSVGVYHSIFTIRDNVQNPDDPTGPSVVRAVLWDLYAPHTNDTVHLPDIPDAPVFNDSPRWDYWEIFGYDTGIRTFETFTSDPDLNVFDATLLIERSSRNKVEKLSLNL